MLQQDIYKLKECSELKAVLVSSPICYQNREMFSFSLFSIMEILILYIDLWKELGNLNWGRLFVFSTL